MTIESDHALLDPKETAMEWLLPIILILVAALDNFVKPVKQQ
jgi:hypothetical protein